MTPIEIIAFILVLLVLVKLIVILINPKSWQKTTQALIGKPILTIVVSLVLAAVVLYYLLAELTIVQIFAVMAFLALLMMLSMAAYSKEFLTMAKKILKDRSALKKCWLPIAIWIVLMLWVLYALFL